MDTFMQTAANTPGGLGDNKYIKTSQYQFVKIFRTLIAWGAFAIAAITRLLVDVFKGLIGKS
jgi:hypothetical protein